MASIWDSILEGQQISESRKRNAMKDALAQQSADSEAESRSAAARLNNATASTIDFERAQKQTDVKGKARADIDAALREGDLAKADYLSRTHFGQPVHETTKLPEAPQPVSDPGPAPDPQYGPAFTPDDAAQAKLTEVQNNGGLLEQWMQRNPDATDIPDTATMSRDLAESARTEQAKKAAADEAEAKDAEQKRRAFEQFQTDTQTYAPRIEAARARPTYQAGDMAFDPKAGEATQQADIEAAQKLSPEAAGFLKMTGAFQKAGLPTGKAGEAYLSQAAKSEYDNKAEIQAQRDAAALERQKLKNEGALDVAKTRGKKGGGGSSDGSGWQTLTPTQRKAQEAAITADTNSFMRGSNYSKLLNQYQKGQMALQDVAAGNPISTSMGVDSMISSARGGAATGAFLKYYQEHRGGAGDTLASFIERVSSGDEGPGVKANLLQAIKENLNLVKSGANDQRDSWVKSHFSPNQYDKKGNMEDVYDRLWGPFGFDPITRDPNGGYIGATRQVKPKSVSQTLVEGARKASGKPAETADEMLAKRLPR